MAGKISAGDIANSLSVNADNLEVVVRNFGPNNFRIKRRGVRSGGQRRAFWSVVLTGRC